jgi:DNA repair protein RadC
MTAVTVTSPRARALRAAWVKLVREAPVATDRVRIVQPSDVHKLLQDRASAELVEVFYVVALDSQSQVIACAEVTRGLLSSSLVHPREVFRLTLAVGAAGIIVAHNHPSGDPTPSADDRCVTRQLVEAGRLLDVPVFDHVILGGERYVSFSQAGLL